MFSIKSLFLIAFLIKLIFCLEQKCILSKLQQSDLKQVQMSEAPRLRYYSCKIDGVQLSNHNESVITNTSGHTANKTDLDVKFVYYWISNYVKFIPVSIFTKFPNLEYFTISEHHGFVTMKAEYLKNAIKLKYFYIYKNKITELGPNLFREARNLEHINLQGNNIECINLLTFHGLLKIQGIYLQFNRIKKLHPYTFSDLKNILKINLLNNTCIHKYFIRNDLNVRNEIIKRCVYNVENVQFANLGARIEELSDIVESERKVQQNLVKKIDDITVFELSMKNITKILQVKIKEIKDTMDILNSQQIKGNETLHRFSTIMFDAFKKSSNALEVEFKQLHNLTQKRLDVVEMDFQSALLVINNNFSHILSALGTKKYQFDEINETDDEEMDIIENLTPEINDVTNEMNEISTSTQSNDNNFSNVTEYFQDDMFLQIQQDIDEVSQNVSRVIHENFSISQSKISELEQKLTELVNKLYLALVGISAVLILIVTSNIVCFIRNSHTQCLNFQQQDVICNDFEEKLTMNKLKKLYAD